MKVRRSLATRASATHFTLLGLNTMKKVRRSLATALLLLALTTVALADGQIDIPLTTPKTQGQTDITSQGQINTPPTTSSTTGDEAGQMGVPLTDVALTLLQSLPTLF